MSSLVFSSFFSINSCSFSLLSTISLISFLKSLSTLFLSFVNSDVLFLSVSPIFSSVQISFIFCNSGKIEISFFSNPGGACMSPV